MAIPNRRRHGERCRAFTLIELLITVAVIGIMAVMVLFAAFSAQEMAKVQKTKALIAKLDAIIKAKWESYKTRRVAIVFPPAPDPSSPDYLPYMKNCAQARLECLRDLMRLELPDRWTDVADDPVVFTYGGSFGSLSIPRPSVSQGFLRRYSAGAPPTGDYAGAECLYMIVMQAQQEDADDRSVLKADMLGDKDGDGFPEIQDAWGEPIRFLRWPAGFQSELQVVGTATALPSSTGITTNVQSAALSRSAGSYIGGALVNFYPAPFASAPLPDSLSRVTGYSVSGSNQTFSIVSGGSWTNSLFAVLGPDPFDPARVSPKVSFATYPLIYSSGPDKSPGICADFDIISVLHYSADRMNPCPSATDNASLITSPIFIGSQRDDKNVAGSNQWVDNIHNHMITIR